MLAALRRDAPPVAARRRRAHARAGPSRPPSTSARRRTRRGASRSPQAIRTVTGARCGSPTSSRDDADAGPAERRPLSRRRARRPLQARVRRRGAPPPQRRSPDAPAAQPAALLAAGAEDDGRHAWQAQEELKDERVEAVRRRRHGQGHDDRRPQLESIAIDPDAVDPEDVEMLQDMVVAAVNEALRSAQELQESKLGGLGEGFDPMSALDALGGAARRPRRPAAGRVACRAAAEPRRAPQRSANRLLAPPLQRLVTELGKLPGIGNGPRSGSRSTPARLPEDAPRWRRDPRREGEDHALRGLLQPRRGAALHGLPRRAPRRRR